MTGVAGVRPDVDVVLGVRHKVHPAQVGGLESCLEGEMSLLSLPSVAGGPDDQPGDVGLAALVLTVTVPHDDDGLSGVYFVSVLSASLTSQ